MWFAERKFAIVTLLLEIAFIITFGFVVEYDQAALPKTVRDDQQLPMGYYYPMFQDVHVMVFVGLGFLFTFLRKYGYSAVACNMFIGAFLIQWALLCEGFSKMHDGRIYISIESLITADVAAATGLISWGALLGKTSPLQMLVMGFFEMLFYAGNEWFAINKLWVNDPGTSMTCHMFAAYFGLAVSFVLYKKSQLDHPNDKPGYTSDVFSMLGTIFLWAFWPSFNSVMLTGDARYRAVMNTYLSMTASCVMTFAISSLINKQGHFNMVHVQNSTLAGGVAIGSVCNVVVKPYGALVTGSVAAIICTQGFKYLQPFLARHLRLHDTGGINNLHGMVGILSGVAGAVMAATSSYDIYGLELYQMYPAMVPPKNSTELAELQALFPGIKPGLGRSNRSQAAFQAYTLLMTFGIAVGGGLITGLIMRLPCCDPVNKSQYYDDTNHWEVPLMEDTQETNEEQAECGARYEDEIQLEEANS